MSDRYYRRSMTKTPAPSDLTDKFMLRMPPGMRDRVASHAKANGRSMNAEIVQTLESHYPPEPTVEELLEHLTMFANLELSGRERSRVLLMHTLEELRRKLETER